MARRRLEGLERVLGVNALFSTAYGNVGSSIYYALGLVASYALGLTPIVFIITGFFFFCTAATYAEATAMFPEAGGSSSFARRAFNEFWSFFAAWSGMLTYTVTIAISAFFVPHYIGGVFEFAEALKTSPGDIIAAVVVIALLAGGQRLRRQGVDGDQRHARGRRLPHPGAARAGRRGPGPRPRPARRQRLLRRRADLDRLHPRHPDRHARLHGHRDRLEHGRGGQGRGPDDPGGDQPRAARRLRHLLHAPGRSRSPRCPSPRTPTGSTRPGSGSPRRRAATPATRCSGWSSRSTSARSRA